VKTQAVVVRGLEVESTWSTEEQKFKQLRKVIAKRQAIIDSLQVRDGFLKVMWDHGVYTKEEYFEMRRKEDKYWKDKGGKGFKNMIPEEIAIIKFHLNPSRGSWHEYNGFNHVYVTNEEVERWMDDKSIEGWKEHLKKERITYTIYGDQIKYDSQNEIEWVF
jgi:hypothetical protein